MNNIMAFSQLNSLASCPMNLQQDSCAMLEKQKHTFSPYVEIISIYGTAKMLHWNEGNLNRLLRRQKGIIASG